MARDYSLASRLQQAELLNLRSSRAALCVYNNFLMPISADVLQQLTHVHNASKYTLQSVHEGWLRQLQSHTY